MKWSTIVLLIAGSSTLFATDVLSLDSKRDSLIFAGYTFEKVYDEAGRRWTFRASKDGHFVRSFGDPEPNEMDLPEDGSHLSIGTIRAVSGTNGQVVIHFWTGGTKCCDIHWIIGFAPELRVLLDTSQFRFDGVELARDIDGDGNWEFSFGTTTFDYFAAGYAFSPRAHAWFKIDSTTRVFIPANDLCFGEIEKQIRADEAKLHGYVRKENAAPDGQEFREILLNIVLAYLYAGMEQEAWSFFGREYRESDRNVLRENVERKARSDPYFQAFQTRKGRR